MHILFRWISTSLEKQETRLAVEPRGGNGHEELIQYEGG